MSAKRVWRTPMAFARAPTDLTTSNVTRVMSGVAGMADTANVIHGLQADEEGGEGGGGGGSSGVVVRRSSWRRSTSPRGRFSMQALHADVGFVGSGGGGGGRGGGSTTRRGSPDRSPRAWTASPRGSGPPSARGSGRMSGSASGVSRVAAYSSSVLRSSRETLRALKAEEERRGSEAEEELWIETARSPRCRTGAHAHALRGRDVVGSSVAMSDHADYARSHAQESGASANGRAQTGEQSVYTTPAAASHRGVSFAPDGSHDGTSSAAGDVVVLDGGVALGGSRGQRDGGGGAKNQTPVHAEHSEGGEQTYWRQSMLEKKLAQVRHIYPDTFLAPVPQVSGCLPRMAFV